MWYIIISILVIIVQIFIIRNLLKKTEKYEETVENQQKEINERDEFIIKMNDVIKTSDVKIRELDVNLMFSGDDDIGFFFETVKNIQSYLNAYKNAFEDFKKEEQS